MSKVWQNVSRILLTEWTLAKIENDSAGVFRPIKQSNLRASLPPVIFHNQKSYTGLEEQLSLWDSNFRTVLSPAFSTISNSNASNDKATINDFIQRLEHSIGEIEKLPEVHFNFLNISSAINCCKKIPAFWKYIGYEPIKM